MKDGLLDRQPAHRRELPLRRTINPYASRVAEVTLEQTQGARVVPRHEGGLKVRPAWLTGLLGDFLPLDDYLGKRLSEETVRSSWNAGAAAGPWATRACVLTWLEDFHEDIKRVDIPKLILHGTADRILSAESQGRRLHAALPDAHYVEIDGGSHVMCVTHAKEVNRELLAFLRQTAPVSATAWSERRPARRRPLLTRAGPKAVARRWRSSRNETGDR